MFRWSRHILGDLWVITFHEQNVVASSITSCHLLLVELRVHCKRFLLAMPWWKRLCQWHLGHPSEEFDLTMMSWWDHDTLSYLTWNTSMQHHFETSHLTHHDIKRWGHTVSWWWVPCELAEIRQTLWVSWWLMTKLRRYFCSFVNSH